MKKTHLLSVLLLCLILGFSACRSKKEGCYYGNIHLKKDSGNHAENKQYCNI